MPKATTRVIWQRHKPVLWLVILLTLLSIGLNIRGGVTTWANRNEGLMTRSEYLRDKKEEPKYAAPTYQAYIDETYDMYQSDPTSGPIPYNQAGVGIGILMIIGMGALGLFVALWDSIGNFDRFLFGSGASRRRLYWTKQRWYLPVVTVALLANTLVPIATYYLYIPLKYINLTSGELTALLTYNLILGVAAFLTGHFIGIMINRPVIASLGTAALAYLLQPAISNALTIAGVSDQTTYFGFDQPGNQAWLVVGIAAVIGVISLFGGAWAYRRISLEHSGELLLVPQLRWLVISVLAILLTLAFAIYDDALKRYSWVSLWIGVVVISAGVIWQKWPQLSTWWRERRAKKALKTT